MKKIFAIVNYTDSILSFRLNLLNEFKNQGYEVIICAPQYDNAVVRTLNEHGIRFQKINMDRTGINPFNELATLLDLYQIYKKERPNAVLNYTLKPIIYSSLAAYLAKVPFIASVLTGFGSVFLGTELKTKLIRFFVKPVFGLALKCNNKIFALNPDIIKVFDQHGVLNLRNTTLINGEGLDVDYYKVEPLPHSRYPVFLIITRLIRDKGIYEYVEAAKAIKVKYPQTRFLIVGYLDTNPTALTRKELEELLADGIIEYLGKMEDVRVAIAQSSVYVLPSYAEGIPRSTLEAMAMGRPVITTDAPGCRETVIDGVNGYLVPVKNVAKLVEAMENFILKPELIGQMGAESRNIAVERYDVNKVNKIIVKEMGLSSV